MMQSCDGNIRAAEAEMHTTYQLQPICLAQQETLAQLSTPETNSELQG